MGKKYTNFMNESSFLITAKFYIYVSELVKFGWEFDTCVLDKWHTQKRIGCKIAKGRNPISLLNDPPKPKLV